MKVFEDVVLTDSIEIRTTPEKIFEFFRGIVDDESYRAWHPDDHVSFRWLKGGPWEKGSVGCAEEYLHGKLHKGKFLVTDVVPNRRIVYVPLSRIIRFYIPGNTFEFIPGEGTCTFKASGSLRVGRLAKIFAGKHLEYGLASVRKHMKEEGENLKRILEKAV